MLLKINFLTVSYGGVEALKSVSLELEGDEVVGILGANGAGKSTLIRTISGVKSPEEGELWFVNRRIDKLPPQRVFGLGIATVPEGRRLFPRMNVLENLLMGTNLRKDRNGVEKSLEYVFSYYPVLKNRWNQKAGTLSGGEQQMVAIGRALMANAKLMLLDEPSMGLSPLLVNEMFTILKDVSKNGTAILIAEQNAIETLKFVKRAYILEVGTIAISGRAEDVVNNEMVKKTYLGRD
ncbi:MAG: ABC transporter ATP-binding protein [Methanotrichaceae archaeon]|nr:ABC transporter ATP-binding protein [Methanotrichaceae archaeon]